MYGLHQSCQFLRTIRLFYLKYTMRHGRWGMDRLFRPTSIARGRSHAQRTCLIVFHAYHTAEPRRSTYTQLTLYNIRKSPLFTKYFVQLISRHDFFCVAQATLGLLKLTQPGKVHRWSFQTLQCVAVKTRQFGLNFRHAFVWRVMRFRPIPTLAAALPQSRPFPGSRHGARK